MEAAAEGRQPEPEPEAVPEPEPELEPEPQPEPEPEPEPVLLSSGDGAGSSDDGAAAEERGGDSSGDGDDEADDEAGGGGAEDSWSDDEGEWQEDWVSDDEGDAATPSRRERHWNAPAALRCPLTRSLFSDPVAIADGHTYERKALTEWFDRGHRSSPVTRKRLPEQGREMHPNFLAKQAVESYQLKVSGGGGTVERPTAPSRDEVLDCVDRFEDEREIDTGEIRRRNRRTRRAAAWDEQVNHSENWMATVDPASGRTYYYNRLTRVTQWERPQSPSAPSDRSGPGLARPLKATHPGMAAFPGMKPAVPRPKTAGKGRLYGLCVWLSAVVVLCACGAAASLAVWLLGLWPDTTPRPELFASSAAAMVVQWSIFLVDGRRRLGGGWIGSSILLAIAVINLVLFL